jgi:hypothetical protein
MRAKLLRISTELLFDLLRGDHPKGYRIVKDELPADALLVNVRHGFPNYIEILVESESFEEMVEGQEFPFLTPVAEKYQ